MTNSINNNKGFTLMELMVTIAIISVLSAIAISNYMPMRAKAMDTAARSDARNLVDAVVNAVMNHADVQFTNTGPGGAIGVLDSSGTTARKPIFVLSNNVAAIITGSSAMAPGGNNTIFTAYVYNTGGTPDNSPLSNSGKKEYMVMIDANAGTIVVPQ